jgi:3-phosphoshikimate 1-carboxyvinyltransferase
VLENSKPAFFNVRVRLDSSVDKMALPELIEIVPLTQPVRAEITVPGSKSITNRALILAALANGEVTLRGALWSEDTQVMTEALLKLGFHISVKEDQAEFCNRTITVKGLGGKIPKAGSAEQPLELFVGNAGTAARFLAAFVCLGDGVYRLSGVPRMHERPQAALFLALRELGYRVESENGNDKLPAKIFGCRRRGDESQTEPESQRLLPASPAIKKCRVSIQQSSQFASALLLSSKTGGWKIEIFGVNEDESPYVAMTSKLMGVFPWNGGLLSIEPDASSGSYFLGAGWLLFKNLDELVKEFKKLKPGLRPEEIRDLRSEMTRVDVAMWPDSRWQIDTDFAVFIQTATHAIPIEVSRAHDLGDSIMTAIVLAPFNARPVKFTDLGRLRVQECERVVALRTELTKLGAQVTEQGDTLTVHPSKPDALHGTEIETYNDHRMAMCFAILGLKIPGIKIKNPACVKKTFPNFFQKLAAPPPNGLGASILDAKSGRKLSAEELFAD